MKHTLIKVLKLMRVESCYFGKPDPVPNLSENLNPDPHFNSGALETLKKSQGVPGMLKMEAWSLKMKPLRVCGRPGVADLHHFNEKPDANPDPQSSEKSGRIRMNVKRGIRIRIKGDANPQPCYRVWHSI